jgi:hypothetical protein
MKRQMASQIENQRGMPSCFANEVKTNVTAQSISGSAESHANMDEMIPDSKISGRMM